MKRHNFALMLIGVFALASAPSRSAAAASNETPTIDQSLNLKSVSSPRISPDGRFVAYQVSETNWTDNEFISQIWVVATATGERYQLTSGKKSSNGAAWAPDSKRLAFISDRDGKRQIYVISPTGGEAVQMTKLETGVDSVEWSPDGRLLAYTAAEPESKSKKDRKEKYGEFEIVQGDYAMTRLWTIPADLDASGKMPEPQNLTPDAKFTVGGFRWSPDSQHIAFSAAKDPDLGSQDTSDIFVLTVADKSVKKIVNTKGPDSNPVWSPDGKQIAFQTSNASEFFFYTNSYIATVPAEGGPPRVLNKTFDEDPGLISWSPAGIYFAAAQKTYAHLFKLDPATGAIERVSGPDKMIFGGFSFDKEFRRTAFVGSDSTHYGEVLLSDIKRFEPKTLTEMGAQLKDFRLASREVIEWKSTDGTPIEGVLIKPAGFDPAKKYPLLVVIHGGPTGVDRATISADRYYPIEMLAAKGALILRPNYRGSAGYGEKFRSLNVRNLGVGDYWDVISGVDYLIGKGMVDRDRVGSMGWSEGGYISAYITTFSDRFRAVSVGAGVTDWMTYYVNTDIHPFTRQYLHSTPWDDPEIYRKTSPITYVNSAKTPTLIQHGELDKRVPIPNAYELYQALQDKGVPVKMVVYKGFGHGITKPKQQRSLMEQNYEWFSEWIWGEKPEPPSKEIPEKAKDTPERSASSGRQ
jgi:dipeptidyl aminopeptidase/acylaminoacyl peptidase